MKKINILIILITMIVCGLITMSVYADFDSFSAEVSKLIKSTHNDKYISSITVKQGEDVITVDGEEQSVLDGASAKVFMQNSSLMFPVRTLAQQDKAVLTYDEKTETVRMSVGKTTIEITNEQPTISINNVISTLSESPAMIDGVMYVPLEDVASALGYEVNTQNDTAVLTKPFQTKRLIVKTKLADIETFGATTVISGFNDLYVLQYETEGETKIAFDRFSVRQGIEFVEIDKIITSAEAHKSWGTDYIGADTYNDFLISDKSVNELPNVVVAVVDTGVEVTHDFLVGRVTGPGVNFSSATNANDVSGHGTHVSGIIVDATLPNVKIMPVKVLNDKGSGTNLTIYVGLQYAIDNGCDVINMSLGGPGASELLEEAVLTAISKNIAVLVAAGNETSDASQSTPANIEEAITVGALNVSGAFAYYSNYGAMVDIWAPGSGINSSIPGNKFGSKSGTSMATPTTAAVAAMLKSFDKDLTHEQIDYILKGYAVAKDIGDPLNSGLLLTLDVRRLNELDKNKIPAVQYSGGAGTVNSPYLIGTAAQLAGLANDVNKGNDYAGTYFKLTRDIDLNVAPYNIGNGWTPIGNNINSAFGGIFDGDNYKVKNLYINSDNTDSGWGLFGNTNGASIKNLGVLISDNGINVNSNQVGGLIGNKIDTMVVNCHVTGGDIAGNDMVGGLIGNNGSGEVNRSSAVVNVAGASNVGGLMGQINAGGSVSNVYADANVAGTGNNIGGLIGYGSDGDTELSSDKITVTNAYATGVINGSGSGIGGLVGYVGKSMAVNSSYWNKEIGKTLGYGINRGTFGSDNKGYTTEQMNQESSYIGFNFKLIWDMEQGSNNDYPFFKSGTFDPPAPTGLSVSQIGTSRVVLTWDEVKIETPDELVKVDAYDIYAGREYLWSVKSTSTVQYYLLPDTIYTYKVIPRAGGLVGDASTISVRTKDKLDVPKGIKYNVYSDRITLIWESVQTAEGYCVYVDGNYYSRTGTNSITVYNLTPGTEYTFGVVAYDDNNRISTEPATAIISTLKNVLPAPTGLKVTNITATTMTVSWEPVSGAYSYTLSYNNSRLAYIGSTSYTIERLTPDTNYTIGICTRNEAGEGNVSSMIVRTLPTEQDATLSGLRIMSSGNLAEPFSFSSGVTHYTLKAASTTTAISFNPTPLQSGVTITVNGIEVSNGTYSPSIGLNFGSNTIDIVVTAADRVTTKTYTFIIIRQPSTLSTVNTLSSLIPSTGELSPAFSSSTTAYDMVVPYSTTSISFVPTTTHSGASIMLYNDKSAVESGTESNPSFLFVGSGGSNVVDFYVTAEDGATTKRYRIAVKRLGSNDATLSNIVPFYEGFWGNTYYMFEQEFSEENDTYTLTVPYSVDSLRFNTTINNSEANVSVNESYASTNVKLSVGKNTIPITVTAEDGVTKKTYTVIAARQSSSSAGDASLVSLMPSTGEFSTGFKSAATRYAMGVPNDVSEITFRPAAYEDEYGGASIKINGKSVGNREDSDKIDLKVGDNIVNIEVTSKDGTSTKTYTVMVSRQAARPSNDAKLVRLVPSYNALSTSAALYPKFSENITEYDVPVPQSVNFISFRHTPSNFFSTVRVNGEMVERGDESKDIVLKQWGHTIIPIDVTAEDGVTVRRYTIRIVKQPQTPSNLKVTNVTSSSATITWDNEESADSYNIYNGSLLIASDILSNTYTVNDLKSNTAYSLRVAAKNMAEISDKVVTECKTLASVAAPAVPSGLNVTNVTTTSMQFNWTAPGGTVTEYEVSRDNWITKVTLDGGVTTYKFTGLVANTEYTLHVRALNGSDTGDSTAITVETAKDASNLPEQPTGLTLVSATTTSLQISWDKMNGATAYQISLDGLTWTDCGRATGYNFTGLPIGLSTLYVRARNGRGVSSAASISAPTVPGQVRPAPVVTDVTQTTMTLEWEKVDGATEYEIYRNKYSTPHAIVSGDVNTVVLEGLTYTTTYEWYVRAKNSSGIGEASDLSTPLYPEYYWLESPVRLITSGITETEITLSWVEPPIATSYIMYLDGVVVAEIPAPATSFTFTGLTPGKMYLLRVEASDGEHPSGAPYSEVATLPSGTFVAKGLVLSDVSETEVTMTWDKVDGAEYYELYENRGGTTTKLIATTTDNSYTYTNLTYYTPYMFGVVPVSSGHKGSMSTISCQTYWYPPSAPMGLIASKVTQNEVTLKWDWVSRATAYEVYYGIGSADTKYGDDIIATSSYSPPETCTISGLDPGITYKFAVVAKSPAVSSGKSSELTVITLSPVSAPVGLTTSGIRQTQANLKWNSVPSALYYEVSIDGNSWKDVGNVTEHTFTGLGVNSEYMLYVRAANRGGVGAYSSAGIKTLMNRPEAPTVLIVSGIGDTYVNLSWNTVAGAEEYEVYYGIGSAYRKFVTADLSATLCTIDGLLTGTEYKFSIVSKNPAGISRKCEEISVLTTGLPQMPTGLTVTEISQTQINLTWNMVSGATGYEVAIAESGLTPSESDWSQITDAEYRFTDLTSGTDYTLYVRSVNGAGVGAAASISDMTMYNVAPGKPVYLEKEVSTNTIKISWPAVRGATGYEVKYSGRSWAGIGNVTSYTFTDLSSDYSYTVSVRAKNDFGMSEDLIETIVTLPGPLDLLSNPVATEVKQTQITITWGIATGAESYEVQKLGDGDVWISVTEGTTWTFTGLEPNSYYTLRVRAVSGNSKGATKSLFTVYTLPNPPRDLYIRSVSATSIGIGWDSTVSGNHYVSLDNSTWSRVYMGSATLSSLTPGNYYTIYLCTGTSSGYSESISISAWTLCDVPANLNVLSLRSTQITLGWDPVVSAEGYQVQVKQSISGTDNWIDAGNVTSYTFTELTPNRYYYLFVRAVNAEERTGGEIYIRVTTLLKDPDPPSALVPQAPENIEILDKTVTTIAIGWTPVSGNVTYEVSIDGNNWIDVGNVTTYTFEDLQEDTVYMIFVRAVNEYGVGDYASVTEITMSNTPTVPQNLEVTSITSNTITISWSVPNRGNVTGYEVSLDSDIWIYTGDATTYTFEGLNESTRYIIYVRAVNGNATGDVAEISETTLLSVPIAPQNIEITDITSRAITISWSVPESGNVTGYEAVIAGVGIAVEEGDWENIGNVLSHTFNGLNIGTEYVMYVRALNASGKGGEAHISAVTKLSDRPDMVIDYTHIDNITVPYGSKWETLKEVLPATIIVDNLAGGITVVPLNWDSQKTGDSLVSDIWRNTESNSMGTWVFAIDADSGVYGDVINANGKTIGFNVSKSAVVVNDTNVTAAAVNIGIGIPAEDVEITGDITITGADGSELTVPMNSTRLSSWAGTGAEYNKDIAGIYTFTKPVQELLSSIPDYLNIVYGAVVNLTVTVTSTPTVWSGAIDNVVNNRDGVSDTIIITNATVGYTAIFTDIESGHTKEVVIQSIHMSGTTATIPVGNDLLNENGGSVKVQLKEFGFGVSAPSNEFIYKGETPYATEDVYVELTVAVGTTRQAIINGLKKITVSLDRAPYSIEAKVNWDNIIPSSVNTGNRGILSYEIDLASSNVSLGATNPVANTNGKKIICNIILEDKKITSVTAPDIVLSIYDAITNLDDLKNRTDLFPYELAATLNDGTAVNIPLEIVAITNADGSAFDGSTPGTYDVIIKILAAFQEQQAQSFAAFSGEYLAENGAIFEFRTRITIAENKPAAIDTSGDFAVLNRGGKLNTVKLTYAPGGNAVEGARINFYKDVRCTELIGTGTTDANGNITAIETNLLPEGGEIYTQVEIDGIKSAVSWAPYYCAPIEISLLSKYSLNTNSLLMITPTMNPNSANVREIRKYPGFNVPEPTFDVVANGNVITIDNSMTTKSYVTVRSADSAGNAVLKVTYNKQYVDDEGNISSNPVTVQANIEVNKPSGGGVSPSPGGGGGGGGAPKTEDKTDDDDNKDKDDDVNADVPPETETGIYAKKYISGYDDNTFKPSGKITRAESVAILARISNDFSEDRQYGGSFPDVDVNSWYSNYIGYAYQNGFVSGHESGEFKPNNVVTRAEFSVIITRFFGLEPSQDSYFEDCIGHWAEGNITALALNGYVTGYEDNTFRPNDGISRAEVVKIINSITKRSTYVIPPKEQKLTFTDVEREHWAYNDILIATIGM